MPEITTPSCSRFFYRKMGKGPAVVLIHGFPESSALWHNVGNELSLSYTLFMPDLPGSGNSALDGDTGMGEMAACINSMLAYEQVGKAVIAGHSMGGYVGFEFANRYPDKVAGLSLVHSTCVADDEEKKKMRQKSMDIIRSGGKSAFIKQMVPTLFSASFKQANQPIINGLVESALQMGEHGMVNFYKAMGARNDYTAMLPDASFPIQWIAGIDDNIIPYNKTLGLSYQSHINFVSLYHNCGHMSMIEAPGKLVNDLKDFINYTHYNHMI